MELSLVTKSSDCGATSEHRLVLLNRQALTTLERFPVIAAALSPHCLHSTVMHTLTCDSVLCDGVCFRAKGSGTDGVSCRERFGGQDLEGKYRMAGNFRRRIFSRNPKILPKR